jgi:hypothetical protein
MINLEKELENYYGTEKYHPVDHQYALTDGIVALLEHFDSKIQKTLINLVKNVCSFDKLMVFVEITIKDDKLSVRTFRDLTEDGQGYIDSSLHKDLFTVNSFEDCKIRTMIYNYVWLLMSEY